MVCVLVGVQTIVAAIVRPRGWPEGLDGVPVGVPVSGAQGHCRQMCLAREARAVR
jgi:hypothetical protein